MAHAKGEYVWFIDSDDYILENTLFEISSFIEANPCDCCVINFMQTNESAHKISIIDNNKCFRITPDKWNGGRTYAYPWLHIMSRSFLCRYDIKFEIGVTYQEDTLWMFWVNFFKARKIYTSKLIYAYRQRLGSAVHSLDEKRYSRHLQSMQAMLSTYQRALNDYGDEMSEKDRNNLQHRIYWSVQNVLFDALRVSKATRDKIISQLIVEGFYPYPILWGRLTLKDGWKNFAVGLFALLFPIRCYYQGVCWLLSLKKKF